MLGAAFGGCGDGSPREGAGNESLAVMCGEISQDENDPALERETREWCLRAFRDTGDAEVRGVLKAIRSPGPAGDPYALKARATLPAVHRSRREVAGRRC